MMGRLAYKVRGIRTGDIAVLVLLGFGRGTRQGIPAARYDFNIGLEEGSVNKLKLSK